jgi:glycine cleavage system H protein
MNVPAGLRYTSDHEWVQQLPDGLVRMGITDYAQDALGDVVFVELPSVGVSVGTGDSIGEVESTKSVSEIYAPVPGSIVTVNTALGEEPSLLNSDPYGDGWICEFRLPSGNGSGAPPEAVLDTLLDADGYRGVIAS